MSVEIRARWAFCSSRRCGGRGLLGGGSRGGVEWGGIARVRAASISVLGAYGQTASVATRVVAGKRCIRGIALGMALGTLWRHSSVSAVVVPSLIEGPPGLMASVATLAGAARACTRIIALVVAKR